ncbi:hypothetical protein H2508_05110 [Parahaliea sp. F7430]|uniref:DUF11 domain-containing protein n=1 Tax=Sediminihaliea albiluteola TaxID=2758564 RepID=A0A7W2TV55_9GAMM|nr:DUF11 domain-containing protein [Sediminihaliea albiluteola]MBA6412484.1 hypothetical protein [Sediminihaliea albiluteola]
MSRQVPGMRRPRRPISLALGTFTLAGMMASPLVQAGFENGSFQTGDLSHWTTKDYKRTSHTASVPLTNMGQMNLTKQGSIVGGNNVNRVKVLSGPSFTIPNAPELSAPRWGDHVVQIGGEDSKKASSLEQKATMTVADVDPADGKVHIRFAVAPVINDPDHPDTQQPFFFVEVINHTKGEKQLFNTFNFANQPGVAWKKYGDYLYTDWQGFDIAPGNGLLDVGDEVTIRVVASNCGQGAADHTAVVYMDALGAFMPNLAVSASGPSTTQPGQQITYRYDYINSGDLVAADSKVQLAAPFVGNGVATAFFLDDGLPENCVGDPDNNNQPFDGAPRGDYIICNLGDVDINESGSFDVTFTVPNDAPTTASENVVNNGDYFIEAGGVDPFIGPLVQTGIVGSSIELVDLGVTIDDGGRLSYAQGDQASYTVTVKNHGDSPAGGELTLNVLGLGADCTALIVDGSPSCMPEGDGLKVTYTLAGLAPEGEVSYTFEGSVQPAGPVNVAATVEVTEAGKTDSYLANNTAGSNLPVGAPVTASVNAVGTGAGQILAVPGGLACGDANTACSSSGLTGAVVSGAELRLTPVARPDSIFTGWSEDSSCENLNDSPCIIQVGDDPVKATANFALAWLVKGSVDSTDNAGSILPPAQKVPRDSQVEFDIVPELGYVPYIDESSSCQSAELLPGKPYRYQHGPVTQDCEFVIGFTNTDVVDVIGTVEGPHGEISSPGTTWLNKGGSMTYEAIPEPGYVPVFGGSCVGSATGASFTASQVQESCEVVLSFVEEAEAFEVISSVDGSGGRINIVGPLNVAAGETRSYTLLPDEGFTPRIAQSSCPGIFQAGQPNTYTVGPVEEDCAFSVGFTEDTVDVSAVVTGGNGEITPPGITSIARGGETLYTALPDDANGKVIFGGSCAGEASAGDNTFYARNVQEDCVVEVTFVSPAQSTGIHTITLSVDGEGGTIDGVIGSVNIFHHGSRDYRFSADPGLIPYLSGTCPAAVNGGLITVGPVTEDCDLVVKFGRVAAVPVNNPFMLLLLALAVLGLVARQRS